MPQGTTFVSLVSALILPCYASTLQPACSMEPSRDIIRSRLLHPCHPKSAGLGAFDVTKFKEAEEQNLDRLGNIRNVTKIYHKMLKKRINRRVSLTESCLQFGNIKKKDLRKAVKNMQKCNKKRVEKGLRVIQKMLRSYFVDTVTLLEGVECLHENQRIEDEMFNESTSAYSDIKKELLDNLCSYQQWGVKRDLGDIDALIKGNSCKNLNEIDLEGYRMAKHILRNLNVKIPKKKNSKTSKRHRERSGCNLRPRRRKGKKGRKDRLDVPIPGRKRKHRKKTVSNRT